MEPTTPTPQTDDPRAARNTPPWAAIALGVLAAVLALVLVFVLVTNDDDEDVTADTTTTTVEETTTTAEETTTTVEEATTTTEGSSDTIGGITRQEAAHVVWPDPASDTTYDTPEDAAEAFAEELLGFDDPVYGELMEGDSRSGEIEVRAADDGPATTVGVRQMSDDNWYVLFASSPEVELLRPTAGSAIDHPLDVEGWGRGFEGQIRVAVFERGATTPLGETTATAGSGDDLDSFTATIDWPDRDGGGWGVVVATTSGGPDGTTWAATAIPVGFIGGD